MESGWEWICNKISEGKKVAVFCTSSLKTRSIPFLVWYLWKHVKGPVEYDDGYKYDTANFIDSVRYLDKYIQIKPNLFDDTVSDASAN